MKQIIRKLAIALIQILCLSSLFYGQPKYHTVPKQMMENINMNNSSSPMVTTLTTNSIPGFNLLTDNNPSGLSFHAGYGYETLSHMYPGFTPVFTHQIVNDKDGNILFFIIDNYIYNKNGFGFETGVNTGYFHTVYGDLVNFYDPYGTETSYRLHNDIIIVPVPGSCNEFHMFYVLLHKEGDASNELRPRIYYKRITFVNENEIQISNQVQLSSDAFTAACSNASGFSMDITPYDETLEDYLLVVQWIDEYEVFQVGTTLNTIPKYIDENKSEDLDTWFGAKRPDPVLIVNNETVYYINSASMGSLESPDPTINHLKFPRNFSLISNSTCDGGYLITTDNVIGMENSPNNNYVYFTYENSNGIKYLNIGNYINNSSSFPSTIYSIYPIGNYTQTQIERFNDGKLYALNHHSNINKGTYTSINNPNSPTTTNFTYNCFNSLEVESTFIIDCDSTDFKRYIFNHQIDDSDYTTNYPSVYCVQPDWSTIGSTETWSPGVDNNPFRSETGVVYLEDDFEIPSGKYIQLNDMEFHFAESKKAIVNTGSTLRLVGSTLTSADMCGETVMWGGVYLEGNSALDQSTSNQGRLRMDSGSEISNATNGVYVEGGGICEIYAGTFKNNYISINMAQYTHPTLPDYNASFIQLADFINDDVLNNGSYPSKAVYMSSVKGIDITYSSFVNTMSNTLRANYRGMCIRSASSDFVLDDCEINGYYYGVYTAGGTPEITSNTFENNFRGIYTGTSINVDVSNNLFDGDYSFLPPQRELFPNPPPYITSQYNVYISGDGVNNTVYKFEGNTITNGTIGSLFYSTGPNAVQAKDNSYSNITGATNACAAVAIGKNSNFNSGSGGDYGLEFRCNSFSTSPYALSIIDGNMRKYQGEYGASSGSDYAGNCFDHYGTNAGRDFYVDLDIVSSLNIQHYDYYSHADDAHTLLEEDELINGIPSSYTQSKVTEYEYSNDFTSSDCEEDTGGGGIIIKSTAAVEYQTPSVSERIDLIENIDTEILLLEAELEETTDAGNTFMLLSEVETMADNNSIEIAEEIAELDGYISDEVAITYMQNNSGNEFAKANALLENSPLPTNARSEIENMDINPGLKHIINLNQQGVNVRDNKQAEIAKLKQFRGLVVNEMYITATKDTSSSERQELKQFLQNEEKLQSKFHLYNLNRFENDRNSALATLEIIRQYAQNADIEYAGKMEDYIDLQQIMIDIESGIISYEDAVENNTDLLNIIATDENSFGYVTANQLLAEAGINEYYETIKLPEPEMEDRSTLNKSGTEQLTEVYDDIINIYPNPASDVIYIEYAFFDNDTDRLIEIYGINGNLIDKINLSHAVGVFTYNKKLPAGNYIIKLGNNYSQKITVQ